MLIIVFLAGFLIIEAYFRLLNPQNTEESVFNEWYAWEHIPGYKGTFKSLYPGEFNTAIRINSRGLRDHEYNYWRNSKRRVVVLGDSYANGHGVELEETFSKVLEDMIGKDNIEIINAGHKGYGPQEEIMYYRHEISNYQPDIVLMAIFMGNDIHDVTLLNISDGKLVENGPLPKPGLQMRLRRWMARKSHTYVFVLETFIKNDALRDLLIRWGFFMPRWSPYFTKDPGAYQEDLDETIRLIRAFNQELEQDNTKLMILLIPTVEQAYEAKQEMFEMTEGFDINLGNEEMMRFCEEEGLECLDLLSYFHESEQELYYEHDRHFTALAHDLTARLLYQELLS